MVAKRRGEISRLNGYFSQARDTLRDDLRAARERDPAAYSTTEILLYQGLHAVWMHRVAHALYVRGHRFSARLVSQISRFLTGIEIHPGARIGRGLFIDHGMGVVIGETTEIGDDVTLYQGVTLGGTGKQSGKRHPTVGNRVIVGTGAQVLGPLVIGDDAKIGAGAIVVKDVPPETTVVGNPGRPVVISGTRIAGPDIEHTRLPDPVAESLETLTRRVTELEHQLEAAQADRPAADGSANGRPQGVPARAAAREVPTPGEG
jgi:serine O-acetyltransferase